MTVSLLALTFDCEDAAELARFWADVLGRQVHPGASEAYATVGVTDPVRTGPLLVFHQVPEGKAAKNRVHPDLFTTEMAAETERLLGLGALRRRDVEENGHRWTTFIDPEGNEFDLVAG